MQKPLRKADLTTGRAMLVELMSQIGHGRIEGIPIRDGEPLFHPRPRVLRSFRFGGDARRWKHTVLDDFSLKEEVVQLFDEISRIGNGIIVSLDLKDGLPCGLLIEACAIDYLSGQPPRDDDGVAR